MLWMPTKDSVDAMTRERIRAWLEFKIRERGIPSNAQAAEIMGVAPATVSRVRSGDRTPGLDFVLAMWRRLHIPLETMLEQMPPGYPMASRLRRQEH